MANYRLKLTLETDKGPITLVSAKFPFDRELKRGDDILLGKRYVECELLTVHRVVHNLRSGYSEIEAIVDLHGKKVDPLNKSDEVIEKYRTLIHMLDDE